MPVDRNSHSGVGTLAAGSRTTVRGIISGWLKLSLTWRTVSVQPAPAENSPADNVVGIAIMRTPGGLDLRALGRAVSRDPGAEIIELFGRADRVAETQPDHLRRIGDRAAADRDDQIGAGLARHIGRGDDIGARGVRADLGAGPGKAVAEHPPQTVRHRSVSRAKVPLAMHKNRAGVEPVDLLRQRLGKRCAENDILHLRKAVDAAQHGFLAKIVGWWRGRETRRHEP